MSYTVIITVVSVLFMILIFIMAYMVAIAYRAGVRDGYQNTFLPYVQEIVLKDHLLQGERVINETRKDFHK